MTENYRPGHVPGKERLQVYVGTELAQAVRVRATADRMSISAFSERALRRELGMMEEEKPTDARTSLSRWAEGIDHEAVARECGEDPASYQGAYARLLETLDDVDGWEAAPNTGSATDYGAQASYRYRYDSAEYTVRLDHEGATVIE